MWILLDISVIALFILFVVSAYKAGIIRSLFRLIGAVVAIVLSSYIASVIAEFVYNQFVRESILNQVNIFINDYISNNIIYAPDSASNSIKEFVLRLLIVRDLDEQKINQIISDTTINAANEITNAISPMIINSIRTIVMIILFILFNIIIKFLIKSVGTVCKLPVIKQVDNIFGAILGIINFFVIIMIIMLLIRVCVPMMKDIPEIFSDNTINSTYIFKYLYYNNLMYEIFLNIII